MTQQNLTEAQAFLDQRIQDFFNDPCNADGGSYEDRLLIKYKVANMYNLDPIEEEQLFV